MKLGDLLSKVSINKKNGQLTTCFKKNTLKKVGISQEELLNMKLNIELKKFKPKK